jgi:hypothetical protein
LLGLALWGSGSALATDLHVLWDDRCGGCHGHAAAFARDRAALPAPDSLSRFLRTHRGGLPDNVAEGVAQMLTAQAATPPRFMEQCRICHGRAADFARDHLLAVEGKVVGRYSGRDIEAFMKDGHARLDAEGAAFFAKELRRVLGEVRFGE